MDFLELIDKFIEALMGARANMEGQIQLEDQEAEIVDRMNSPTELQAAGLCYRIRRKIGRVWLIRILKPQRKTSTYDKVLPKLKIFTVDCVNAMKMLHCFESFFLVFMVKNAFSAQFSVTVSRILLWQRFQHKNIIL